MADDETYPGEVVLLDGSTAHFTYTGEQLPSPGGVIVVQPTSGREITMRVTHCNADVIHGREIAA